MRIGIAFAALAGTLAAWPVSNAYAQDTEAILKPRNRTWESPQHFALELRFAPYKPQIDDEPALGGKTPYKNTFGDNPRLEFAVEFDWQAVRIPYLGTLGPGFSVGYTSPSRPAKKLNSTEDSGDETSLDIFPMYAVAVLRADVFMRYMHIPLVPYAKAGIGYAPWRTYTSGGTSYVGQGNGQINGKGQTFGFHGAAGAAFQLDIIDPHSAKNLDEESGVNHTYIYAEWMFAAYNGIGQTNALRVGTSTWVAGLAFEF
jgi:hypothetical protein